VAPAISVTLEGRSDNLESSKIQEPSSFIIEGTWPNDQLHLADYPEGRVAVVGDCWANRETIDCVAADVLASGNPERLIALPGNFSVILSRPDRIAALGSLSGDHCLYYGQTPTGPTISTRPTLGTPVALDRSYLAAQLVIPGAEAIFGERSSFEDIFKIPGGHAVQATNEGFSSSTHTRLAPEPGATLADAAARVREALSTAIEARIASGRAVTADLSGGMDSSSIAFLALGHLGDRSLPVFFTNPPNPDLGDALYVRRFLELEQRFSPTFFTRTHEIGRYSHTDALALPVAEDLTHAINLSPREKQYFREYYELVAQSQESDGIHLSGYGGDEVAGSQEFYLADAWRSKDLRRFLTDGLGYARLYNASPLTLWRHLIGLGRNGVRGALLGAAHTLENPPDDDNRWELIRGLRQPGGPGLQWLMPEAREALAETLRYKADSAELAEGLSLGDFVNRSYLHCAAQDMQALRQLLRSLGLSVSVQAPFLDHNVILASFSVGAAEKANPHEFKQLLRRALDGAVPAEVLERRSKGSYDASRARSAIESLPAIQSLLRDPLLGDLGIVDPLKVRQALQNMDTASNLTLWSLDRIVAAELWLRGLTEKKLIQAPKSTDRHVVDVRTTLSPQIDPTLPDERVSVPSHVQAIASPEGALVFFNQKKDKYYPLDRTRSEIARQLAATGSAEAALEAMVSAYPQVDRSVLKSDVLRCCEELLNADLLQAVDAQSPNSPLPTTTGRVRLVLEDGIVARSEPARGNIRMRDRLFAVAGLAVSASVLKWSKAEHRLPILQKIQELRANRDATSQEATNIMRSVQSLPFLGRLACLESSYTAAVTAALFHRRRVEFHRGVSFAPLSFHAWIEAQGEPVTTEYDGFVTGSYQSFNEPRDPDAS